MFAALRQIENPWVRSATAAVTALSVATFATSIALGATNSKDESAAKSALSASLLLGAGGALFGLMARDRGATGGMAQAMEQGLAPDASSTSESPITAWTDWRNFVVVRKIKESEEITSFYLRPEDMGDLPSFQPGQFLTIKLDIPSQARAIIRTYSLSDYAEQPDYYRLSIKRELMPAGLDVPPGIASNFMHDCINVGAVIPAKPPSGKFVLDVQKSSPAVLISNGVGITPMISMAKAATDFNPDRPIWFFHGARDSRFHAFRDEISAIAQQHPALNIHFAYSRPHPDDVSIDDSSESGHYHSIGYIDTALIQSRVMQDAEYFLCGSPAFMESIRAGLKQAGVPDSRVLFESFMKAAKTSTPSPMAAANGARSNADGVGAVVFARSQKTAAWQPESASLLEFAEANDLNPPYSCRQGICGTCECKLLEGEVEYNQPPTAAIAAGSVLICIAKPKTTTVVLDL